MASVYNDLNRPPLNEHRLQRALMVPGAGFNGHSVSALRILPEVDSTNTALLAAAADGAPHGSVVIAEAQSAGKGRLGRAWVAPPRSGLFVSILLRPETPPSRWGWLPLLAGVAARSAVAQVSELEVALKWPNDLILPGVADTAGSAAGADAAADADAGSGYGPDRKLGGILAEQGGDSAAPYVVVGIGINVSLREDELPAPHATSLVLAGASVTDRDTLLRVLLRSFGSWYTDFAGADGDAEASGLAAAYRAACATIDRPVRAEMPGGATVSGHATGIDADGRLVVRLTDGTSTPIGAGDVVHLR
jgi:BirA family transcriptional regulator, biotin operon repressor / biotin---[acetyl-CoA-carboxylase] ligase